MSRLVLVVESRFKYNTFECIGFDRVLWSRYLQVYDELIVLVRSSKKYKLKVQLEDGVVTIIAVKSKGVLNNALSGIKAGIKLLLIQDEIIFRTPGLFTLVASFFNRGYKVELVGDIEESLAAVLKGRTIVVLLLKMLTKVMVKRAKCVLYVNKSVLPLKYYNENRYFASNVNIDVRNLVKRKNLGDKKGLIHLYSVGSLNNLYKGPDILIEAVRLLPKRIQNRLRVCWIGEGTYKNSLVNHVEQLEMNEIWAFKDNMLHNDLLSELSKSCDLFILPSRTEGLPRVVIEAMSLSLPVLAFNVGGISELLSCKSGQLINDVDSRQLSLAIEKIIKRDTSELGIVNFEKSKQYDKSVLNSVRINFLRA